MSVSIPSQTSDTELSSERPGIGHPVVFFDGVCGLCNQTVNFLISIDRHKRLRYAPLQGETAKSCLSENDRQNLSSMVLHDRSGLTRKSTAIARTLMHVGGFWKVLGFVLWLIPAPFRNFGYGVVARNRYWIWGKTETCRMPRSGERELFLP